jgi:hypothetical protein
MTADELLSALRRVEARLRSPELQQLFEDADPPTRQQFVGLRLEVSRQVAALTTANLAAIQQQLSGLEVELRSGIAEVEATLVDLQNTMAILSATSKILATVGRGLALM